MDTFVSHLVAEVAKMKYGMPWTEGVQITPLPEPNKPAYLTEVVNDALAKGAKLMNSGGAEVTESFFTPAILYPVSEGMKIYREEQFGPIIPIVPFDDLEEPMTYMETSDHGQQVSIFGTDATQIAALVDHMVNQVCRVNINAQCQRGPDVFPFTGRKDSAEGTLSVNDALRSFSIRTLVATKDNAENKKILNEIVDERSSTFLSTKFLF